ncbi:putative basic amino acid antiporter YfcC [Anaeromicrobium sediminis]|uniref:Basic amino acid antiporter YfcC n=1 Tax=Anaeromicrobium sediminis TaxID=1478221 RepID=A0A267MMA2_9FIRM|nr:putative basic amino acid antiporter YfcC [Anaeromicrobium sediminis]PAB60719.1 hypothetical protein CCE28_04050 [Anaeromicrobium sediminis]
MSIKGKHQIEGDKKPRAWEMPDTYLIIFFVILFAALLTYLVPIGSFEMEEVTYLYKGVEKTKTVPVADSFHFETDDSGTPIRNGIRIFEPYGGVGITNYMFEGLVSGSKWGTAVGVIAFILIIGGAFGIVIKTSAVDAGMFELIKKTKGNENYFIPIIFVLFSLGGAIFGMAEETIAFAMILIPIIVALGYDSITGLFVTYIGAQIGFATSWMNPFTVAIAQGVSDVPILSGAGFRLVMWSFFTLFGIVYSYRYAKKVKKNPESSIAYQTDAYFRNDLQAKKDIKIQFTTGHKLVLLTIFLGICWIIYGVVRYEYYLPEIATQFFIMGVVSGIIGVIFKLNNMKLNDIATSFRDGAKDLLGAALVVGMANGIVLVLGGTDAGTPSVLNTVLNWMSSGLAGMPAAVSAWFMYIFQSIFNFFVVSGSGQAALTMPIMAPLADLVGVNRQVAVLAFQLGDGFTNMIVPTSGVLMGVLGIARLEWSTWAKFMIKIQAILMLFASIFIIAAVLLGFS